MTPERKMSMVSEMVASLKSNVPSFKGFTNQVEKHLFTMLCALRMELCDLREELETEIENLKQEMTVLYNRAEELKKNDYRH